MLNKLKGLLNLVVALIVFMILILIFAYALFWTIIIGGIIFIGLYLKIKFFPSRMQQVASRKPRIIEHD